MKSHRAELERLPAALPAGVRLLAGYLGPDQQRDLYAQIEAVVETAPFYVPSMPGSGKPFSVEMTNCGTLGWVADKGGYRYQETHPVTGVAWPAMPETLVDLWRNVEAAPAGCGPEACLINLYRGGAKLGSHADSDERAPEAAIVSVSLGDDAVFHIGGVRRADPKVRIVLRSGDVLVMGGAARLIYHGIDRIFPDSSRPNSSRADTYGLIRGGGRINLTMRRVNPIA